MNHQFKSGDPAVIVGSSKSISPNIGMAVELVQKRAKNEALDLADGRRFINRGPESWVVQASGLSANLHTGGWLDVGGVALVEERHLIPLRGDFAPEQQKSKEAEPCA
ncbi:hypothetical protein [Pseudomonas viridiflava]|uniref:hypothetical protein n=1 Tax=Pseudomonas viridiflava TaxID=33069 RepID=UPI002E98E63D|nr:hypothetical protein [Pseudomonas viridiflava]